MSDGLTVQQRRVLMRLAAGEHPREIYDSEGISSRTFNRWLRDPTFSSQFDDLFSAEDLRNLKKQLDMASLEAYEVYQEAMREAVKRVRAEVTCPHCKKTHSAWVTVEDWKAREHAADQILKISGLLIERRQEKIDVTTTHRIELSPMESLELLAWKSGIPIPPSREKYYRENGFIEGEQPKKALPPGTIDATEVRVVNE